VVKPAQLQQSGFSCGKTCCNSSVLDRIRTQNQPCNSEPLLPLAAAVPPINTLSCTVSSNKKGGKLVPDTQFKFFTCYHHLKVSILDDSVVDLLRFNGKIRYQTKGGWWRSKKTRVVKDDGSLENYVGRKFIEELKRQGAVCRQGRRDG